MLEGWIKKNVITAFAMTTKEFNEVITKFRCDVKGGNEGLIQNYMNSKMRVRNPNDNFGGPWWTMKASKEEVATTVIHRDNMVRGSGSNVQAMPARDISSTWRDASRGRGSASNLSNVRQVRDSSRTRSGRNEVITPGLKRLADTEDDEIWAMAKEDNRYTQARSREMEEDILTLIHS